jgi:hypothetical protein
MEETSSLEDLDTLSSVSLFKDLEEKSKTLLTSISECKKQVRQISKRVEETKPPILTLPLKPRAASKKWMEQHNLPEQPTLQEFLNCFFGLYAELNRLDRTTMSVFLRKEEAKLFHLPEGQVDIFEVLAALPVLFH